MNFCGPHEGRHTGVLVSKKLDELIDSIEIHEHCFKAMTTDIVANMRVVCRESSFIDQGLTCFANTLNLIVNNGINKVEKVQFKKLATACHKSTLYCEKIKKEFSNLKKSGTIPVNYTKIIQPVETR
jgi:hypothetical protein